MRRLPRHLSRPGRRSATLLAVAAIVAFLAPLTVRNDAGALAASPAMAFRPGSTVLFDASNGAALAKVARGATFAVAGGGGLSAGKATAVLLDVTTLKASKAGKVTFAARLGKASGPPVTLTYAKAATSTRRIVVPLVPGASVIATGGAGLKALRVQAAGWIGAAADDPSQRALLPCRIIDSESGVGVDAERFSSQFDYPVELSNDAPAGATAVVFELFLSGATAPVKATVSDSAVSLTLGAKPGAVAVSIGLLPVGVGAQVAVTGGEVHVAFDVIGYVGGGGLVGCNPTGLPPSGAAAPAASSAGVSAVAVPTVTAGPVSSAVIGEAPPTTATATTAATNATIATTQATSAATTVATVGTAATAQASSVATTASTQATTQPTVATTTSTTVSTTVTTTSVVAARAVADRADDFSGPQIHVIYMSGAIPGGQSTDRNLDGGAIQTSLAASQGWLQGSIGKQLRIDTFQNAIDITYMRSDYDQTALGAKGETSWYWIEQDLIDHSLEAANKYYLVYYDGAITTSCGNAARPPAIGGRVAVVFLRAPNCQSLTTSVNAPGYLEFVALHEVFHVLGAVPDCAAGSTGDGHLTNPNDLMYHGGGVWSPTGVDVSHTAYWLTGRNDCTDLSRSALLTPPGPDLPPFGTRAEVDGA